MTILLLLLSFGAVAAHALSMGLHQAVVLRRELGAKASNCASAAGYLLMFLALVCAVVGHGWAVGPVAWVAALGVNGFILTLLLATQRRRPAARG